MKNNRLILAVDFDGTCTSHEFPKLGKDIGAVPVLKKLVEKGHHLILYTMRCDHDFMPESDDPTIHPVGGYYLSEAIEWFKSHDIPLYGVQRNPTQDKWTASPKCYAHVYLDDAALGCPLKWDSSVSDRPFVDWNKMEELLKERGIL
jgi:hypothetical protein